VSVRPPEWRESGVRSRYPALACSVEFEQRTTQVFLLGTLNDTLLANHPLVRPLRGQRRSSMASFNTILYLCASSASQLEDGQAVWAPVQLDAAIGG
jgi:hypothetical protein